VTTTDGKAPRLELVYRHEDGDIVMVLEASFRGDVRKVIPDIEESVTKEDAETRVAANFFEIIRGATQGPSDES